MLIGQLSQKLSQLKMNLKLIYPGCYQIRSFYNKGLEGSSLNSVFVAVLDAVQTTIKEWLNFIGFLFYCETQ